MRKPKENVKEIAQPSRQLIKEKTAPEQVKAKDLQEKRRHNRKHPLPVTFE
jgi:hypothetical protein